MFTEAFTLQPPPLALSLFFGGKVFELQVSRGFMTALHIGCPLHLLRLHHIGFATNIRTCAVQPPNGATEAG